MLGRLCLRSPSSGLVPSTTMLGWLCLRSSSSGHEVPPRVMQGQPCPRSPEKLHRCPEDSKSAITVLKTAETPWLRTSPGARRSGLAALKASRSAPIRPVRTRAKTAAARSRRDPATGKVPQKGTGTGAREPLAPPPVLWPQRTRPCWPRLLPALQVARAGAPGPAADAAGLPGRRLTQGGKRAGEMGRAARRRCLRRRRLATRHAASRARGCPCPAAAADHGRTAPARPTRKLAHTSAIPGRP